jgi:hypothetical protein
MSSIPLTTTEMKNGIIPTSNDYSRNKKYYKYQVYIQARSKTHSAIIQSFYYQIIVTSM